MKVMNGHLESAQEIVSGIASQKIKNHLLRLGVLKCKKALTADIESYVEVKNDLVKEYGTEVDGGIQVDPKSEGFPAFVAAYEQMANAEATYSGPMLPPLVLDMVELSTDEMELLIHVGLIEYGDEDEVSAD